MNIKENKRGKQKKRFEMDFDTKKKLIYNYNVKNCEKGVF